VTHRHGHDHHTPGPDADARLLLLSLAVILAFTALEVTVGIIAQSLALLADAGHMLTDASALVIALVAARAASRPPRGPWTFGFGRAEVLAAQANGIALALVGVWITVEAVRRLLEPREVDAALVLPVSLAGIAVTGLVAALLARAERRSLNIRGAYLHILTDVAAFAGTALAALLILLTGWNRLDPAASLAVAALALFAAWTLVRDSGRIFLEGAPPSAPPDEVGEAIVGHPGVVETHDVHVWTVTDGFPALSAHVLVEPGADCHRIRLELERVLRDRFGLEHTTLQVDHVGVGSGLAIDRYPQGNVGEH
jgi:cobalt-zinc-cadmium efflux system protein